MWKVHLVTAILAGVGAHAWGASAPWSVVVGVLAPGLPAFLVGLLRGAGTRAHREDPANSDASGLEFEERIARIARASGVPVIMTSVTGDFGVDLVVGRRPHRLAIQCKRQSRPVGASAVQEVVAGAAMHDCARTMVVTNHDFTPAARKLADRHGCTLVGGRDLPRLGSLIRRSAMPVR